MIIVNTKQEEIIKQIDGFNLVIAGAGTGKTATVLKKMEYMFSIGISPEQVLAITFTNKAANEMKMRLKQSHDVLISTFHAFCLNVLRQHKTFTVIDEKQSLSFIKKMLKKEELSEAEKIQRDISYLKNQLFDFDMTQTRNFSILTNNGEQKGRILKKVSNFNRTNKIYVEYQNHLNKNNLMDFDDLIKETILLLTNNPSILNDLQEQYRYIIVDEFQDTNFAQMVLLLLLTMKYKNLCAIGDDFQSIYGFRGGDIQNILQFKRYFPNANLFVLNENYRNTQTLLKASNQLIKKNKTQTKKELFTLNPKGEKIKVFEGRTVKEEISHLIKILQTIPPSNFNKVAVLYRSHHNSQVLEKELINQNIPFEVVSDNETSNEHHGIKLMTVHQAKGLEFSFVFVIGMENGNFPNRFSLSDKTLLEEERRLFYVAITRAKEEVFLSYAINKEIKSKNGNSSLIEYQPSLFLKELGKANITYEQ